MTSEETTTVFELVGRARGERDAKDLNAVVRWTRTEVMACKTHQDLATLVWSRVHETAKKFPPGSAWFCVEMDGRYMRRVPGELGADYEMRLMGYTPW